MVKPACVPAVPDETGDRSVLEEAKAWVAREYAKPGRVYLGVVHRLDRPVSGVLLFARTSKAAARLTEAFRARRVEKVYWGATVVPLAPEAGTLRQWLRKDEGRRVVAEVPAGSEGAREAVTDWRVLGAAPGGGSRVELRPRTGRPHQLRCALARLRAPLLGDLKYGAPDALPDRSIALHARSLEVEHPTLREPRRFECPAPDRPWWSGWS